MSEAADTGTMRMCRQRGTSRARQVLVCGSQHIHEWTSERPQEGQYRFRWCAASSLWGREDPVTGLCLLLRWAPGCRPLTGRKDWTLQRLVSRVIDCGFLNS